VHDDLPCMDDDVLRRGRATVHVKYDEATALLVGDSLQSLAFHLLADARSALPADTRLAMVRILSNAAGSRGMAGGQAIDLASVGTTLSLPELESMHIHKTGALIRACVNMGARVRDGLSEDEIAALDSFARCMGLAFQVVDDVLDTESTTATLGKTVGKDANDNKPTYVNIMGLARAKEFARELRDQAHQHLQGLEGRTKRLSELADFIVLRKF
jgi:farnesyl diphosphate synthase